MIKKIYLYSTGGDTCNSLSRILDCNYGLHPPDNSFVVNWGTENKINSAFPCRLNFSVSYNKYASSYVLSKKVNTPEIWTDINYIPHSMFPVLGRNIIHSGGTDIAMINKVDDSPARDYYSEYIDKKTELRVHVIGQYTFISEKVANGEYCKKNIAWNLRNGFNYVDIDNKKLGYLKATTVISMAKASIKALGYDFGAVDVIIDKRDRIWVLEVNSAPGLIYKRAIRYAEYFKHKFEKFKERRTIWKK